MRISIDSVKGLITEATSSSSVDGVTLVPSDTQALTAAAEVLDCEKSSLINFSVDAADGPVTLGAPVDTTAGRVVFFVNVGTNAANLQSTNLVAEVLADGADADNFVTWPAGEGQMFVWNGSAWSPMSKTIDT